MKKKKEGKISKWRQRSEHERLGIASRLTWISGLALVAAWFLVLLPIQLYLGRDNTPDVNPQVQGAREDTTPSPTPTSIFE